MNEALTLWAEQSAKPLVLLVDEIDSLVREIRMFKGDEIIVWGM